ncbi:RNA chaperone ProQ [Enterovibrio makurazakiensis]|uniref:RNA chaperone ProQ n=1 Tax=Enterovibrio gelatinilyticus TaxID=2899819 RepID=A0ABT5QUH4_9GAMM|nr:RNA chaperone ProQ [Enterovibrio sp. ZSDZ42]MDD1791664.1 RNA chaperone ProQ [Enterovibrio sp. ZSDZ42]
MENTEKLANSKQVIAYIAERFPKCFTLEGEARPLKIGIFQDLAERLADDAKVSKTQLRAALRQYTSSWRYLYGVKAGAVRVDLDGNDCGELEQEHVDHAQTALAESKARAAERRKEQAAKNGDKKANAKEKRAPKSNKSTANQANSRPAKAKNTKLVKKPVEPRRELKAEDIVVGKDVNVNMGNGNMPATIVELNKDEVRVRLSNGLTMLVKAEHLSS